MFLFCCIHNKVSCSAVLHSFTYKNTTIFDKNEDYPLGRVQGKITLFKGFKGGLSSLKGSREDYPYKGFKDICA